MRLHRLSATAFGPFVDPALVDFDALGDAGIFLVHGATGSGKTSLLDAVCFALYGRVPGARPAGAALRSQHAGAEATPSVTLEFSVEADRWRVTRTPEHHRPKKRGTGLTRVPATVLLERHDGRGWVGRSTRADEVGDQLGLLLGMRLEQFAKVVLLPQGDFAAFLHASAEERRGVLERLFDVSAYTDVETWLADQRRVLTREAEAADMELQAQLGRIDDLLGRLPEIQLPAPAWADVPLEELPEVAARLAGQVQAHAAAALARLDEAVLAARTAEAGHRRVEQQAAAYRRAQQALAGQEHLQRNAKRWAAAADESAVAERAGRIAGDLRAVVAAESAVQSATDLVSQSWRSAVLLRLRGLDDVVDPAAAADPDASTPVGEPAVCGHPPDTATVVAALRRGDGPLTEAGIAARRAGDASARAQQARATRDEAAAQLAQSEHALLTARTAEADAARELADLERALSEAPHLGLEKQRLDTLISARQQLHTAQLHTQQLTEAVLTAAELALAARARAVELRQRRIDGIAAELARGLHPGAPCPVCGSQTHPQPAAEASAVSADELSAAEQRCEPLDAEVAALRGQLASAQALVAARTADLIGEPRSVAELVATRQQVQLALETLAEAGERRARAHQDRIQAAAQVGTAEHEVSTHRLARADAEGRMSELEAAAATARAEVRKALAAHDDDCPCARPGKSDLPGDWQTRVDRHRMALAALTDVDAAVAQLQVARRHLRAAVERATAASAAEGFPDLDSARAGVRSVDAVERLKQELAEAHRLEVEVATVLADPSVHEVIDRPAPDLDAARATAAAAAAARSGADRCHALAETAARELTGLAHQIGSSAAAVAAARARSGAVARLADTVAGLGPDNTLRMRLSSFVLAGRLERVVELANERLGRMADGRYELAHDDALATGGRRSGLGLMVRDRWTGQSRDPATLSGGESFVASLALAMGLADAVREHSGGVSVHTLFVDEGFGSLDEDSLEQVLGVLDELRDGGRCVGVISHVADLRSRIPTQVHVVKTQAGSSVSLHLGCA